MKKILQITTVFTLFILALVSCGPTATQKEEARVRRSKTPNPITWDTIVSKKEQPLESKNIQASSSINISYITPSKYENEEVLQAIQQELNLLVMDDISYNSLSATEAVNKYTEDYSTSYKAKVESQLPMWKKTNGEDSIFSYKKDMNTSVLYDEANFISYQVHIVEYKGGEVETASVKNIVLDLTNGKILTENDIFNQDYKEALNKIIIERIIIDNNVKDIEELQSKGYWGVADLASNDNFYINKDGITYTFNPEEYSDAELGVLKVFINYDDLMELLKNSSPISVLVHDFE